MADNRRGGVHGEAAERALTAWRTLTVTFARRRRGRTVVLDRLGRRAPLWPLSQVLHAGALIDLLGRSADRADREVPHLLDGLRRYDTARGWTATPWPAVARRVFYDDNAWVGLAAAQAWVMTDDAAALDVALRALRVARTGEDPAGGVRWNEGTAARHACSTAPSALLALRLARGRGAVAERGSEVDDDTEAFVERCIAFLDGRLAGANGLIADHVTAAGVVEDHVWSYNQGATIGLHLLAGDVLARRASVERAHELAAASVEYLGAEDRLWREPPAFVAIFLRQLMALDAHHDTHRWQGFVDRYLDRVWREGRDRQTGLVTAGGIGRYDEGVVIDQAALVQLLALQAMPPEWRRLAC